MASVLQMGSALAPARSLMHLNVAAAEPDLRRPGLPLSAPSVSDDVLAVPAPEECPSRTVLECRGRDAACPHCKAATIHAAVRRRACGAARAHGTTRTGRDARGHRPRGRAARPGPGDPRRLGPPVPTVQGRPPPPSSASGRSTSPGTRGSSGSATGSARCSIGCAPSG